MTEVRVTNEWLKEQGAKIEGELVVGDSRAVVLTLKSRDVLVISFEGNIAPGEGERIGNFFQPLFPGNKVVVMSYGPQFTVIHQEA